tara:strand:- start:19199 stop:19642 length:444 start_codon:yes stop_codon:yes gene_type:complete
MAIGNFRSPSQMNLGAMRFNRRPLTKAVINRRTLAPGNKLITANLVKGDTVLIQKEPFTILGKNSTGDLVASNILDGRRVKFKPSKETALEIAVTKTVTRRSFDKAVKSNPLDLSQGGNLDELMGEWRNDAKEIGTMTDLDRDGKIG